VSKFADISIDQSINGAYGALYVMSRIGHYATLHVADSCP